MQMRQTGILDSIAAPAANPRIRQAAAEQIVDADVPNELQALVEKKKALELLQSAARREVMRQRPPPAPPQTTKTQVEGGIASLLKDLLPGLAQRGQQLRRMNTRRQAGLPTVPSNMRMAASGGIVGYDNGGDVEGAGTGSFFDKLKRYPQYSDETGPFMSRFPEGIQALRRFLPDQFQNAAFVSSEFLFPQLKEAAEKDPSIRDKFNQAFRSARDSGKDTFDFIFVQLPTPVRNEINSVSTTEKFIKSVVPSAQDNVKVGINVAIFYLFIIFLITLPSLYM